MFLCIFYVCIHWPFSLLDRAKESPPNANFKPRFCYHTACPLKHNLASCLAAVEKEPEETPPCCCSCFVKVEAEKSNQTVRQVLVKYDPRSDVTHCTADVEGFPPFEQKGDATTPFLYFLWSSCSNYKNIDVLLLQGSTCEQWNASLIDHHASMRDVEPLSHWILQWFFFFSSISSAAHFWAPQRSSIKS